MNFFKRKMPLNNNFKDYNTYWESRGFHKPSLRRAKIISKHLNNKKNILDIGFGDGTVIDYLNKNNNPKEIRGIDISTYAVEYVKKKGYKVDVIDITNNEFNKYLKKYKFDYIILTEVIEHIQNAEDVIDVIKKESPEATLFISIPNSGFFMHRLRFLFGQFPIIMIQQHIKEHIRFWTYKDFKYWAGCLGYFIDDLYVSDGIKVFGKTINFFPGLLGVQIIYKLKLKK